MRTSCTTSPTTARSWTSGGAPCSAVAPRRSQTCWRLVTTLRCRARRRSSSASSCSPPPTQNSAPSCSRSRSSTAHGHGARSCASRAHSSRRSWRGDKRVRLPVADVEPENRADERDHEQRERDDPRPTHPSPRLDTGVPPLARCRERSVDLTGEEHVARLVELLLRDVDVDACHIAYCQPVHTIGGAREPRVDAARLEARLQYPRAERSVDRR